MTRKRHWRKFNFKEWRSSPELLQCSRAARSLWLDLCGLIYEAEDGGRLTLRGAPYDSRQLAAVLGDDPRTITAVLKELGQAGVYSVDPDGAIFCRRIRREMLKENISQIDPEVTPEVSKGSRRYSKRNKALRKHNETQIPEPELEPCRGSNLAPEFTNVVEMRPRAVRRGSHSPLATNKLASEAVAPTHSKQTLIDALRQELAEIDRIAAKYPETGQSPRRARIIAQIQELETS